MKPIVAFFVFFLLLTTQRAFSQKPKWENIPPRTTSSFRGLSVAQKAAFTRLMACEDMDLLDWLLHQATPTDPELEQLVEHIRNRVAG